MKFIFDKKTNNFQMTLEPEELELAKTNPESFKILMEHQNKVKETIANNLINQIKEQNAYRLECEKVHVAEREAIRKSEFEEREKIRKQELEFERLNVQKSQFAWDRILYGTETLVDKFIPDQTPNNF